MLSAVYVWLSKQPDQKPTLALISLQSLPPLVVLATTTVRGHWENVFETPILISSHSGSRTHCGEKAKSLPGAEKTNSRRPVWSATVVAVDKQFTVYYQRICKRDDQIKETVNSGGWKQSVCGKEFINQLQLNTFQFTFLELSNYRLE